MAGIADAIPYIRTILDTRLVDSDTDRLILRKCEDTALKRAIAVILAATAAVAGCRHGSHGSTTTPVIPSATRPASTLPVLQPPTNAVIPPTTVPVTVAPNVPVKPQTVALVAPRPAPLATVADIEVSRERVVNLLVQSYGLNMLRRVVQVDMSRQELTKEGLTLSADDIARERKTTLQKMFAENNQKLVDQINEAEAAGRVDEVRELRGKIDKDNEGLLKQLLTQQQLTPEMFDMQMESNACLRKVVEKHMPGKITEEMERQAFNTIYGETVRIRHIQCSNIVEISEAQRRLAGGEPFEQVAIKLSRNATTRTLGGEFPPFSRETPHIPQQFKDVAFSLKVGEVSDPVETNGTYHLLKLVAKVAPKAIKFEDVRGSVHELLYDRWVTEEMKVVRDKLGQKALESMKINDPVMARQYNDLLTKRDNEIKDRDQIGRELEREREAQAREAIATSRPATTAPSANTDENITLHGDDLGIIRPATAPSEGDLRPPATKSGSDTPDTKPATSPSTQP